MPGTTVLDAVRGHARERGGSTAYRTPSRTWTFAQVEDAASRVARGLQALGIGAGDRVACLTKRTAECVALVLGACKIGAVCMPVNWRKHLLRSAGKPIDGVELRVVDPATGEDRAEGQVGEVWIRTAQNMKGYWANPKATGQAFVDRWFRSGDAGYLRDGYVYMHDRIKDMIVSGGENIYPAEVENALMQHPAVATNARARWTSSRRSRAIRPARSSSGCCASATGRTRPEG